MNLIFLGPPGAGKGTLAVHAKELLGVPHISTGSIFREAIAAQSELGLAVKAIIDGGRLVDDATTVALVRERLARPDAGAGYILDGFPRTIPQAQALAAFSTLTRVVNFEITDALVLERLAGRRVCRQCGFNWHATFNPPARANVCDKCGGEVYTRDDDKAEAVQKRLDVYRSQTAPLIGHYRAPGLLIDLDANHDIGIMLADFKKLFNL
ncbi:MAG: nucleoside monophosphate kinase [Spirochaetaceae bacterium]|jgi:adenylate kinase|nr:nucleoside monophosphate kinase [Spirochaetaceae bacterium]